MVGRVISISIKDTQTLSLAFSEIAAKVVARNANPQTYGLAFLEKLPARHIRAPNFASTLIKGC